MLFKDLRGRKLKNFWPEKRSHRIVLVTGSVLFLWFLTGVFNFSFREAPSQEKKILPVKIKTIEARDRFPVSRISAVTEEQRSLSIRAETNGHVIELSQEKGTLVKRGDILVRLSLDRRRSKLAEAKALVDQRKLEYEVSQKLEKKAFRSKTTVADFKAKYKAAMADLDAIQNSIKDAKIIAPFEGVMDKNYVELGSYVAVGDNVVELVDLNPLKVVGFVSEKDLKIIEIGKSVQVHLSTGENLKGTLTYSSSVADPNTRTFRVEVQVNNKNHTHKAGLTADILIPVGKVKAHLISSALLTLNDEGVLGVYGVNDQKRVTFHKVDIISHHKDYVWVVGLPEKMHIITVGQGFVIVDQFVNPVK